MEMKRWRLWAVGGALVFAMTSGGSLAQAPTPPILREWDPVTLLNLRLNPVTLIGVAAPDPANRPEPPHTYLLNPAKGEPAQIRIDLSQELPAYGKKFAVTGPVSASYTLFVDGSEKLNVSVFEKSRMPVE